MAWNPRNPRPVSAATRKRASTTAMGHHFAGHTKDEDMVMTVNGKLHLRKQKKAVIGANRIMRVLRGLDWNSLAILSKMRTCRLLHSVAMARYSHQALR